MSGLVFVGIDVSKASLDIAVRPSGPAWQVDNSEEGIRQLAERLRQLSPTAIVLEATEGTKWLVQRLWQRGNCRWR